MAFSDHKIAAFAHKITDLPDQPNLPADELKARFDSSPEELRQAVNGICDDATTLSGKVDSILAETFDGVVEKSMLSEALAEELDAKAVETSVASRFTAEQTAREAADSSISSRVTTLETTVAQKTEVYLTTYVGTGSTKTIYFDFEPKLAIIACDDYEDGVLQAPLVVAQGQSVSYDGSTLALLDDDSLMVTRSSGYSKDGSDYAVIAFR